MRLLPFSVHAACVTVTICVSLSAAVFALTGKGNLKPVCELCHGRMARRLFLPLPEQYEVTLTLRRDVSGVYLEVAEPVPLPGTTTPPPPTKGQPLGLDGGADAAARPPQKAWPQNAGSKADSTRRGRAAGGEVDGEPRFLARAKDT